MTALVLPNEPLQLSRRVTVNLLLFGSDDEIHPRLKLEIPLVLSDSIQISDSLFECFVWINIIVRVLFDRGVEHARLIPEIVRLVIIVEVLYLDVFLMN